MNHPYPNSMPQTPRPGVIELRPLSAGELISGSFRTVFKNPVTMLAIPLLCWLIVGAVNVVLTHAVVAHVLADNHGPMIDTDAYSIENGSLAGQGATAVLSVVFSLLLTGALVTVSSRAVLGQRTSVGDAARSITRFAPRIAGVVAIVALMVLVPMAAAIGLGLLVGHLMGTGAGIAIVALMAIAALVFAVWLEIRVSLAAVAVVLERASVRDALRRSAHLIVGHWWRAFGVLLLMSLIVGGVTLLVMIPSIVDQVSTAVHYMPADSPLSSTSAPRQIVAESGEWSSLILRELGTTVARWAGFSLSVALLTLLYHDLRFRKEGLAAQIAAAAR